MTYQVELSRSARRDLNALPPKILPVVLEFMYGPLAQNPHRVGKRLCAPYADEFAARRGTYRLRYTIDEDRVVVTVVRVARRAEIYGT